MTNMCDVSKIISFKTYHRLNVKLFVNILSILIKLYKSIISRALHAKYISYA